MADRRNWRQRLPVILAGLAGAIIAVFVGAFSLGSYYATKSPFVALRFDSGNGVAAGKAIALLQAASPETYRMSTTDKAVLLNGLERDPLSKVALRVFGTAEAIVEHEDAARDYMTLAERVSRRDTPTQIWMILDKASHRNLPGTIAHYDKALSISSAASSLLYDSLTKALAFPEIDPQLAPYLHKGRSWTDGFVLYATQNIENVADLGRILAAAAPLPPSSQRDVILRQVLEKYGKQGDIAGARTFAISMMHAKASVLDNFALNEQTTNEGFAPLTWTIPADGMMAVAFAGEDVEAIAPPDTSGGLLTRTMSIEPGRYRLQHAVNYPEGGEPLSLAWRATCMTGTNGKDFWSQTIPPLERNSRYSMDMSVPRNCTGIRFDLSVKDVERSERSYLTVGELSLTRLTKS